MRGVTRSDSREIGRNCDETSQVIVARALSDVFFFCGTISLLSTAPNCFQSASARALSAKSLLASQTEIASCPIVPLSLSILAILAGFITKYYANNIASRDITHVKNS